MACCLTLILVAGGVTSQLNFAVPLAGWKTTSGMSCYGSSPFHKSPKQQPSNNCGQTSAWGGLAGPATLLLLAALGLRATRSAVFGTGDTCKFLPSNRGQRVPQSESAQTMAPSTQRMLNDTAPKFAGMGFFVAGFFFWYTANVSFNIVNKSLLGVFPHPWTVSVVQLTTVVACSALGWISGALERPFQSMDSGFLWRLLPAALCHALGNGLTSVAFASASVSFTHVVKTSEPIWMALGNLAFNGTRLPASQAMALLPIMFGVALASAGELSFTWVGFLAALASTMCFAGRGIFSKRLMSGSNKMSPLNVYALDSLMALVFTLPVAALTDGHALLGGSLLGGASMALVCNLLLATGLSYFAYNAIAFKLLGKLDVVSHAVGNLGKRIFVIGFSVAAFNTPLTVNAAAGSAIAIGGSGLYSYVKATAGKKK